MKSKIIVDVIVLLLLTVNLTVNAVNLNNNIIHIALSGNTIYVKWNAPDGGDGSLEHPFNKIQDGVNAAENGDTVFVFTGTYIVSDDDELVITKSIDLLGKNKETTIIHSNWGFNDQVVRIEADYVTVSGFTMENAIRGVIFYCQNSTISQNIIVDNFDGVSLLRGSHNNVINNTIISNSNGITNTYPQSTKTAEYNKIIGNIIDDNTDGIDLEGSKYNVIAYNIVNDGSQSGIRLTNSFYDNISNNTVTWNGYGWHLPGIFLWSGFYCKIIGNFVANNDCDGIVLDGGSKFNIICKNTIYNNAHNTDFGLRWYGMHLREGSNNNIIFHNDFINNSLRIRRRNARDNGHNNLWFNSTLNEGNYWDDYKGKDNNGDGIGDSPYNIRGGSNQDLYPLMQPIHNISKNKSVNLPNLNLFQKLIVKFSNILSLIRKLMNYPPLII